MYFAAQEGRLDALKYLHTKAKCSLSARNADGWSAIHASAQGGHAEIIEVRDYELEFTIHQYYVPATCPANCVIQHLLSLSFKQCYLEFVTPIWDVFTLALTHLHACMHTQLQIAVSCQKPWK